MDNIHQRKRNLRVRTAAALRSLAAIQKKNKTAEVFLNLACHIASSETLDQSKLPLPPDGFVVKQPTILRYKDTAWETLCLYQIVSMAVLYCWLHGAMGDTQDAESCKHYLDWIEEYLKAPQTYGVVGSVRHGYYLYAGEGDPHPPEWLGEETI